jgi:NAD+ kinase
VLGVELSGIETATEPHPEWRAGVLGVVVHPARPIDRALADARAWTEASGGTFAQVASPGQGREVADPVAASECDLILAIGGDGTVLTALRAAGPVGRPVLGVACGSLGALTSVTASDVGAALDRFARGEWEPRELPGLAVARDGRALATAFNDVVVIRKGAGQAILDIHVDGVLYARTAGDGVVVATPLGSSAYTIAAGGPLLSPDADGMVVTPLAPHSGSIPPLVVTSASVLTIDVDGGFAGARVETDGHVADVEPPGDEGVHFRLDLALRPRAATLLDFDGETLIAGLRRRGVIADSPRLRARDARRDRR